MGRTARAGRTGRACTLAAEPDRKVVKAAVKSGKQQGAQIRQRTVDPKEADAWQDRCDALDEEVEEILREEKEEKALQNTQRDLNKADNILTHRDEIMARPKKTWFESEKDKLSAKQKGNELLNGAAAAGKKEPKRGKLSNKQKKQLQNRDERREGKEWKKGKAMPVSKPGGKKKTKTKPR